MVVLFEDFLAGPGNTSHNLTHALSFRMTVTGAYSVRKSLVKSAYAVAFFRTKPCQLLR